MEIEAIPTTYNKRTFRSHLESKWAAFFDLLNIEWQYEPAIEHVNGINYLPDFWLPAYESFVEIKPILDADRIEKPIALATKKRTIVLVGQPFHTIDAWFGEPGVKSHVCKASFGICRRCAMPMIAEWTIGVVIPILSPKMTCKSVGHKFVSNPNLNSWNYAFTRCKRDLPPNEKCTAAPINRELMWSV